MEQFNIEDFTSMMDSGGQAFHGIPDIHPSISRCNSSDCIEIIDSDDEKEKEKKENIKITSRGLSSLTNIGQTCFMNSAIQSIMNTDTLLAYFISGDSLIVEDIKRVIIEKKKDGETFSEEDIEKEMKETITYNLMVLIRFLWKTNCEVAPELFKSVIDKKMVTFEGGNQHDAQEFLSSLLDTISEETNKSFEYEIDLEPSKQGLYERISRLNKEFKENDDMRDEILSQSKKNEKRKKEYQDSHDVIDEEDAEYKEIIGNVLEYVNKIKILNNRLKDIVDELYSIYSDEKIKKDYMYIQSLISWKNMMNGKISIINDIFSGMYIHTFKCSSCSHESHKFDRFDILTLHLPPLEEDLTRKDYSIYDMLDIYTDQSEENINKYCYHCKCKKEMKTITQLYSIPDKLVIMFKKYRQVGNKLFRSGEKINYDECIDLTKYMHPSHNVDDCKFNIYSSIRHSGGINTSSGHYYSFAKNFITNKWHIFNDESVHPCDDDEVLKSNSYIVFYQK